MSGSTAFYKNGFYLCTIVLIHIYLVQYLIFKKVAPL
jgi:hypothetical protein